MAEEVHEFGDGALDGHVATADDARFAQLVARLVEAHGDGAGIALGDVDDDLPLASGLADGTGEPRLARCVA